MIILILLGFMALLVWKGREIPKVEPLELMEASYFESNLWYDSSVGEYKIHLPLGEPKETRFEVIPDTGSALLAVSGSECRECDPTKGVWTEENGERVNQEIYSIEYIGGQTTKYQLCSTLFQGHKILLGVMTNSTMAGGKPENVLGLQYPSKRPDAFLNSYAGAKRVIFDFPRQKFYLGNYPLPQGITLNLPYFVPPDQPTGSGYRNSILFLPLLGIKINGVPISSGPQWVILDTGSTRTLVSEDLANLPGLTENTPIELTFHSLRSSSPNPTLTFRAQPYDLSVRPLPVHRCLLLGNQWLSQHGLAIDYDAQTVTFFSPQK